MRWRGALIGIASFLLALIGVWKLSNSRTFQLFGDLIASVPCDRNLVALTLDDGPTAEGTQPLRDLLHAMFDPNGIKRRTINLLLPAVRARGYRWVTVGELLATCHAPQR